MTLVRLFEQSAPPATWAACAAHPALESTLQQLFQEGQAGWPQLAVPIEKFVTFLARQLPPEAFAQAELVTLRSRDLYLVCALWLGERGAQAIFDAEYMPRVWRALRKLGTAEALIADIQQNLYGRLLEKQDAAVERWGYSGRGDLAVWLCTCAIREAGLRGKRGQRELSLEYTPQDVILDLRKTPETAILSQHFKDAFQAAFREAVAALTSRERNLLRYHFLAELSIDKIGTIYNVHRATAARWVAQAQQKLMLKTRELFRARTKVSDDSLPEIMELVQSQLSVNLGSLLKRAAEQDPPAGSSTV